MPHPTTVDRPTDRQMVITRAFDAAPAAVFAAWTTPETLKRWWTPKSSGMALLSCEIDARPGGRYRFEIGRPGAPPLVFFGRYLEAAANARLVWTNEEGPDGAVTTLTLEAAGGQTRLTLSETYPTPAALDGAIEGMQAGMTETFAQLDALLANPA